MSVFCNGQRQIRPIANMTIMITVAEPVDPISAEIDENRRDVPDVDRIPWQVQQTVVVVDIAV